MDVIEIISCPRGISISCDGTKCTCLDFADGCRGKTPLIVTVGGNGSFHYYLRLPQSDGCIVFDQTVTISLVEPGASAEIYGLLSGAGSSSISISISLLHYADNTNSSCNIGSIGDGCCSISITSKIAVGSGTKNCSSSMQINNLRLSPQCQVRATPILDTATADCSCSHGATVGDLDRDQLFYLRSRGLDSAAAKITLRGAFEEKILRNFPKASSCNG